MPEPAVLALRREVRSALEALGHGPVLVALSGGADSLALLAATAPEGAARERPVVAVVVDHGLQAGSAAVARRAADQAVTMGATHAEVVTVAVAAGSGPEAAAREARYAALDDAARRWDAVAVLLGHTRDDQAESVLLALARGSGARSLAGMPPVRRRGDLTYVRPLLGIDRATTARACAELGLDPWVDPHNDDPAYTRARVRSALMPVVTDVLGPGAVPALARSADLLRDDADALDAWARRVHDAASEGTGEGLAVDALVAEPPAVRRRVLRTACLAAGVPAGSLTAAHLAAVDDLVARWHGQGSVALPGAVAATRSCGRLTFRGR